MRVPGLVTGLLITGSIPLGDFQAWVSDIDFVAVMDAEPSPAQLAALPEVHAQLPSGPHYDGIYLTREQLAASSRVDDVAPQILAGEFTPAKPAGQLNPVTWLEVARHGVPVRGDRPAVALDEDHLRAWLRGNLSGYWSTWVAKARRELGTLVADDPIPAETMVWGVTGPSRLHHTLATGDVTTRSGACRYTAERFPAWAELCDRAMRARAGADVRFTVTDGWAMTELMTAVIADALNRCGVGDGTRTGN
ncbi:hypothetical protein [Micromonospora coerulea]|uniref:hypothetical protein n=1 Tax=Micromonospora coerulea TaxID=47856 RepID=UPI001906EC59|nr:hypothetical protein [Micromonospora veneta]